MDARPKACAPMESILFAANTCTPPAVLKTDAMMDETSEYFRREARRRKKEFQSRGKFSGGVLLWADGPLADELVDDEGACVENLRGEVAVVVVVAAAAET
ncbi:predicted protein [Histoplasma capsulatum H143]|uniref:Uncharacterized protein n=1 Tax=Ajellomyces capsulatus (strain H143) TaxID=544712 RepID=C6HS88_AJECH|nr:predicted protein [Histoplasma capsulatum H143]